MPKNRIGFVIFVFNIFLTLPAHADIRIGVAAPLSGPVAAYGQQIKAGAQLAIDDINKQGGLLGQKLELIQADDACEPKQAVSTANLMVKDKADLVIGHWCAGSSIVAAPVYNEEGLLMIDPGSIWSKLTTQGYARVFRMAGTEIVMGEAAAKVIADDFKAKSLVVLQDQRGVLVALGDAVSQASKAHGVAKTENINFTGGESDYSSILTRLKTTNPDVIYCSCYDLEAGLFVRQAAAMGLKAKFIGPETLSSEDFLHIVGPQLAGRVLSLNYSELNPDKSDIHALQIRLRNDHIDGDAMMSFFTYAALQIYADAARQAASVDPGKVAALMHKQTWSTILGPVVFAANGDRQKISYSTFAWRDGTIHEESAIK